MRSRFATAAVCALAVGLGGCFVMDELDRASQGAERFSRGHETPGRPSPAPATGRREPSLLDRIGDRAGDLRDWIEEALEHHGPEDDIVRCRLGDELRFTSRGDCRSLGGEVARS